MPLRLIFFFYFLSGISALIYEVLWVRQLALILGNTAQATSTVLAVFLGGLALGAYFCGKLSSRLPSNALLLYGVLEIAIGLSALAVNESLRSADNVYVWLYQTMHPTNETLLAIRLLIAGGLLLIPTMLMGATLPAIVRYFEQFKQSARMFSLIYGLNTLGAAVGSLSACFIGFAYIGLRGTALCATALNLMIGVMVLYFQKRPLADVELEMDSQSSEESPVETIDDGAAANVIPMQWLCAISFAVGFTALSYEVLWTRILRFFLTSLTYSFTIMISTFLIGLAIGSLVYERFVLKSKSAQQRWYLAFSCVQYLAALLCAVSIPVILSSNQILVFLSSIGLYPHFRMFSQPLYHVLYTGVVSVAAILPPAIALGVLFPMIGTLAAGRDKQAAGAVAMVYAWNTIGCVFGSLICGFVLMPKLGSYNAFQWIVLASALTGAAAALFAENLKRTQRAVLATVPVILALIAACTIRIVPATPPGQTTLAVGEDVNGAMRITANPAWDEIQMSLNGSCLATTIPTSLRYMRLLGHLPVLLIKDPKNVLVGCFGTGSTCGACAVHPEVDSVDIVELSKMVINAAPLFKRTNHDVLNNPKVSLHINDVRNFLLTTRQKYDVITFEPPPPSEAGIVNLYTADFYDLVSKRLKDHGIMGQWVPMDQDSAVLWRMMVASARTAFPYVSIWIPNTREAILLASSQPIDINFTDISGRIDHSPAVKASLSEVGLGSAAALIATCVVSGKPLDDFVANLPAITDDYPGLEFYIPWAGPLLQDLDVEAAGIKQIAQLPKKNLNVQGFNSKEFADNWQAIHLLRLAKVCQSGATANQYIDKALSLMPKDPWSAFVVTHRDIFLKDARD